MHVAHVSARECVHEVDRRRRSTICAYAGVLAFGPYVLASAHATAGAMHVQSHMQWADACGHCVGVNAPKGHLMCTRNVCMHKYIACSIVHVHCTCICDIFFITPQERPKGLGLPSENFKKKHNERHTTFNLHFHVESWKLLDYVIFTP